MEKSNETIDILIPVYNAEKYLAKCLNSLLNQTYKNIKIILVDDGSKDSSLSILKDYEKKYNEIVLYTKENEKNISKTRNFLLSKIQSKYFTFFDSDDYAEPTYIEELYSNLIHNNADVSICRMKRHSENKNINFDKLNKKCKPSIVFTKEECICEMLSANLFAGTTTAKLFKTESLKQIKFNENIYYGEDLDFCFKIMQNCTRFVFSYKRLYHYIVHKNSIVTSKFNPTKVSCVDCYQNIIEQVKDNEELSICAKSMQGLIAIEILYYTWRDKYKDKQLKRRLKKIIKESIHYIKKNHRLSKLLKCTPLVWRLTKIM